MRYCSECGQRLPSIGYDHPKPRRFVYQDWNSNKFWEVWREHYTVYVRYGRIGTQGTVTKKDFDSYSEAVTHQQHKVQEKLNKGYWETD